MKGKLGDRLRLQHILDAINEVENYIYQVSFVDFEGNSEKRFATIKQIEIIGEETKLAYPQIPWKSIKRF